jgi:hypothetical protein
VKWTINGRHPERGRATSCRVAADAQHSNGRHPERGRATSCREAADARPSRRTLRFALVLLLLLTCITPLAFAQSPKADKEPACITSNRAAEFVGKTTCVTGKVTSVGISHSGMFFIDFDCAEKSASSTETKPACPFTAVVFTRDTDKTGDLRVLRGKVIELRGKIKNYKDKPEIVITSRKQITTDAFIPALPAEFGADRQKPTNLGQFPSGSKRDRAW